MPIMKRSTGTSSMQAFSLIETLFALTLGSLVIAAILHGTQLLARKLNLLLLQEKTLNAQSTDCNKVSAAVLHYNLCQNDDHKRAEQVGSQ